MRKIFQISALALLPAGTNIHAHTTVVDTVDEGIYSMTDKFAADIPHAKPAFNEMGDAVTETSITIDSLSMFETLAARGDLLEYVEMLGGVTDTSICLNDDGSVTMTVRQVR